MEQERTLRPSTTSVRPPGYDARRHDAGPALGEQEVRRDAWVETCIRPGARTQRGVTLVAGFVREQARPRYILTSRSVPLAWKAAVLTKLEVKSRDRRLASPVSKTLISWRRMERSALLAK